jgi:hypothetical protein
MFVAKLIRSGFLALNPTFFVLEYMHPMNYYCDLHYKGEEEISRNTELVYQNWYRISFTF